jgi:hypothetical protein
MREEVPMRAALTVALLLSSSAFLEVGTAQVFRTETPPPAVNAASAPWQLSSDPIFYQGAFYEPSGPDAFFDGKVMVRTGVYDRVPLYEDATLQPYSVVYVPVGGLIMRPYVRQADDAFSTVRRDQPLYLPPTEPVGRLVPEGYALVPVGTVGTQSRDVPPEPPFEAVGVVAVATPRTPETGPQLSGAWFDFEGARWFNAGRAVNYDPARFVRAGEYRGFPVYRERGGAGDRLFVTVAPDGPIAPYDRR